MTKIVMVGAGSVVFTRRLFIDIIAQPELAESEFVMVDIDREKVDFVTRFAREVVKQHNLPTIVSSATDVRDAMEGADAVVSSISVGTESDVHADVFIPQKYGVEQMVGDTIGPGGVFKGLRTAPVMVDIAHAIVDLAPEAWLLNYTNPMAICTWAAIAATGVKMVGLCHSVQGTAGQLAGYMGIPADELDYWCAGINHMAWYLSLKRNGQDVYPLLREALEDDETYAKDRVRFEVMRHFDYFVTESTRHMGEYVPYFYKSPEHIEALGMEVRRPREGWSDERWQGYVDRLTSELEGDEPVGLHQSNEYAVQIIRALVTGTPARVNASVMNDGIIDNLPVNCCVEVPCMVDKGRISPCHIGPIPAQLAALNMSNVGLQELAVDAVLERSLHKAYQAIALDPHTSSRLTLPEIRAMFDEMVAAQRESLAGYGA